MSVVGISFGSATGGTGFDVAGTVTSILANARAPETAWAARSAALEKQDAALSSLGTDTAALSSALHTLVAFDGALSQKQGAVSNSSVLALTAATSAAAAGSHSLTVQRLARTSSFYLSAVAAGNTLAGSISLQVGSGTVRTVNIGAGNNTVAGLAASINNLNAGVTATVITDRDGSRLSLVADKSGAANEISLNTTNLTESGGTTVNAVQTQTAADAAYTLDGIALTDSTNVVSTALPGITFQLLGTSQNAVTLTVANDTDAIGTAVATFVSSYNALATALLAQESKDSAGNAQPLFGDQTVSQIQSQLAAALAFATGNTGRSSNLAELGVASGPTGLLQLDGSALTSALGSNFTGITNFFQNAGDFGQNLAAALEGLGNTGQGALALRTVQNATEEKALGDNKAALEARLTAYAARLTDQLTTANQILQAIPQQLNEVKQIYAAITGYGNNG